MKKPAPAQKNPSQKTTVLIVGAGPTGLMMALQLSRLGIDYKIVDKAMMAGTTSRALVLHARPFEFYKMMGLDGLIKKHGFVFHGLHVWVRRKTKAQNLGHANVSSMGGDLTPFPYFFSIPQDVHEDILEKQLHRQGKKIDRGTELVAVKKSGAGFAVTLRKNNRPITLAVDYIIGCDGAHSAVRHFFNIDFHGAPYQKLFYVADVLAGGSAYSNDLHIIVGRNTNDFSAIFPLRTHDSRHGVSNGRLVGIVDSADEATIATDQHRLVKNIEHIAGVKIKKINWFSTYHVHHRVAKKFMVGDNVFLLGDAAHIHSPAGGQGMNTGLSDAFNLSWKLAMVINGQADKKILQSYDSERRSFARQLVATTDRGFRIATDSSWLGQGARMVFLPTIFPMLIKIRPIRRFMFRTLSQIAIAYHHSRLSHHTILASDKLRAGDRMAYLTFGKKSNFTHDGMGWQIHIYGASDATMKKWAISQNLPLFVFPFTTAARKNAIVKNALYLLRPDGHIALIAPASSAPAALAHYQRKHGLVW